jgi:hypothetical protein
MAELELDRAKLLKGARAMLDDLLVQQQVISALQSLVDEKLGDMYRDESRIRAIFTRLGFPMPDGPFDADAIVKALETGITVATPGTEGQ